MQALPLLPTMEGEFKLPAELMRDRKPVYEKISRNAYSQKMRPKRRQRDEIGGLPTAGALLAPI